MSLSKKNRLNLILFPLIMISLVNTVFTFTELNLLQTNPLVSAQILDSNPIQIQSTSTYTDDLGNFHIIGEVNNTSIQPQTNVVITAILSDTTNNIAVGNHSAFTSIDTLRTGELSPFDIIITNPQQIMGKFNFMEFSTTSQPTTDEKPANLILNGSSSFLDNAGNSHIAGSIINKGQSPEQFLNLVATFYDNSGIGVIGTQTFGLNVGSLAHNQMAPFDITITDNKTKSQGAFYSLNVESNQSSMSVPLNTKTSFVTSSGFANVNGDGFVNNSPMNNQPEFVNNNNVDDSNTRDDDDDDGDDQRGDKKTDNEGNPWFDDNNCSEESGSSGGSSSECEEAEREEESERDDEDSLEKDQGPPSNSESDSTNDNSGESEDDTEDTNEEDAETENNDNGGEEDENGNN